MIKRFLLLAGMALTLATGFGLSSCSDDDDVLSEDQIRKIIADEVVKQSAGSNNSTSLTKEDVEKIVADYMVSHKTESLTSDDVKKIVDEIVAKQEAGSDNSDPKFDVTDDGFTVVPLDKLKDFLFYNIGKKRELYVEVSGVTNDNQEDLDCPMWDFDIIDLHLRLPNSIAVLGTDGDDYWFGERYILKELIIPSSVKEVNGFICPWCKKLQTVKFLGKIETFKEGGYSDHFEECDALEKIEVPKAYVDYYKEVFPTVKDLIVGF